MEYFSSSLKRKVVPISLQVSIEFILSLFFEYPKAFSSILQNLSTAIYWAMGRGNIYKRNTFAYGHVKSGCGQYQSKI